MLGMGGATNQERPNIILGALGNFSVNDERPGGNSSFPPKRNLSTVWIFA